ncbi:related to DAL5-Allantoate and ureidosuccinate permease [Phialocephala subalpina]|uniref:Related to DAL5-Allantoate and ureidosuccinate permease n=1 Tax=Phialocephala subalpina TaxID=576137 RepID=A0A1L7XU50_9HELO|nr:related to DAL5-Allantoate and ureidosuccinate permease [Phialocephala subalpina]
MENKSSGSGILGAGFEHVDIVLKEIGSVTPSDETLTAEDDRRILRKIDMWCVSPSCLLPVLALSYFFQFLDKTAMSYTAILGLRSDLHLTGQAYPWAASVFYFGYFAFSYPASVIMVRFPVGKFLAISVFLWAGILMCTAASHNAAGLQSARFFLGAMEASVTPGFSIITSMFYKRSEQPLRYAAWFMGNVAAGILGGLIAYGIGHIESIQPWKAVFLIFGAATLAWSIILFLLLPDTPMRAWFLSKDDRIKAVERVRHNMTGIKNNEWKSAQLVEALLDPKSWLIVLIALSANIPNGGISSFGSIVVNGMGFSVFNTLLVSMLAFVFQGVFVVLACGGCTLKENTRTYWMTLMMAISVVGAVMIRKVAREYKWTRLMGYCLTAGFSANLPMVLAMVAGNTAGFTKKTTVNAMIFMAYCVGNIIGPQLFFAREAPNYNSGFASMIVCFSVGAALILVMRSYLIWENRRRDRLGEAAVAQLNGLEVSETALNLLDKTDWELTQFRYVY